MHRSGTSMVARLLHDAGLYLGEPADLAEPGIHNPDGYWENLRFVEINDWRRNKIWSQSSRYSTPELLVKATGEKLNSKHFEDHLKRRYLA